MRPRTAAISGLNDNGCCRVPGFRRQSQHASIIGGEGTGRHASFLRAYAGKENEVQDELLMSGRVLLKVDRPVAETNGGKERTRVRAFDD